MKSIPFNKPYLSGKENEYIREAVLAGQISGDGMFTEKCNRFFEERYGFKKVLLTHSCTAALEMAAILLDIQPGDEVIAPAFTFVSTVNAFVLRGAKIIFADSEEQLPNLDADELEKLISAKTKAIVVVHYSGISCDMDKIMDLAHKYNIFVIEDAAHAIDSYYKGTPLGSIGHMAAFSFHETKNIISGEGGMLVINDDRFYERAEIIREKGTNRSAFFRGEIDKYNWVDIGSSYLPSDIIAAFLFAQLENIDDIQRKRIQIWEAYNNGLRSLAESGLLQLPVVPGYATNNAHMYFIVCQNAIHRQNLIKYLRENGVYAVFHYLSLHKSPYYNDKYKGNPLPNSDRFSDCLIRLPFFYELTPEDIQKINFLIQSYFKSCQTINNTYE